MHNSSLVLFCGPVRPHFLSSLSPHLDLPGPVLGPEHPLVSPRGVHTPEHLSVGDGICFESCHVTCSRSGRPRLFK
jgi:hypothetical protein